MPPSCPEKLSIGFASVLIGGVVLVSGLYVPGAYAAQPLIMSIVLIVSIVFIVSVPLRLHRTSNVAVQLSHKGVCGYCQNAPRLMPNALTVFRRKGAR